MGQGHRDFIPKMIDGASQADCGVLVVNTVRGEYETGLERGGQTREHARLLRAMGVFELIVACNKMDDGGWSRGRYEEIVASMSDFLAQCGHFGFGIEIEFGAHQIEHHALARGAPVLSLVQGHRAQASQGRVVGPARQGARPLRHIG